LTQKWVDHTRVALGDMGAKVAKLEKGGGTMGRDDDEERRERHASTFDAHLLT
jgi:hypothetical protein